MLISGRIFVMVPGGQDNRARVASENSFVSSDQTVTMGKNSMIDDLENDYLLEYY